jgi:quinol monooxygenase YgiN
MKVGVVAIAIHHPRPEFRDELIARVQQAAEVMQTTDGCLSADCWVTLSDEAVVTIGQWHNQEALARSFDAVKAHGVDFDHDDRESRPREILRLVTPYDSGRMDE